MGIKGISCAFGVVGLLAISACSGGVPDTIAVGDNVYAEWSPKTWYSGTVDGTCDRGLHVTYYDGFEKCHSDTEMLPDTNPSTADVAVGTKVVARYTEDAFYDAEVISVDGSEYTVRYYDDIEYTVGLDQMLLDPR